MFLKRLIIVLFIFLFFQIQFFHSEAEECADFEKAIISLEAKSDGSELRNDIGIFFDYKWNNDDKILVIKRDQNNYPIVRLSFLDSKVLPGSAIKSLNSVDLSQLEDNKIIELQQNSEKTSLEVIGISEQIIIQPQEYDLLNFKIDFYINSIPEVNTLEGFFEIDYDYWNVFKRSDWKNEGKIIGTEVSCSISESTFDHIQYPQTDVELVEFDQDQDKILYGYYVSYDEKSGEVQSTYSVGGQSRIRSDFDFKSFPFDTQRLLVRIQSLGDINVKPEVDVKPYLYLLTPDNNIFLALEKYKKENYLKEWSVVDYKVNNSLKSEKIYSAINSENLINWKTDNLDISIIIKRNSNYYLYKIIIPVLLILLIAWSVLWIPTKQIESRLTTSIVALLALIAYNFVFQDEIPKLDMLTSLDQFILLSYLFCAIPIFMTIFLSRFVTTNQKRAYIFNRRMRLWGGIGYILTTCQIFFL